MRVWLLSLFFSYVRCALLAEDDAEAPLTQQEELGKQALTRMADTFLKLVNLVQRYENLLGKLDEVPKDM